MSKTSKNITGLILSIGVLTTMFWNQPVYRNYKIDGKGQLKDLKIVFLSDLHNSIYGKNQAKLLKMIDDVNPDLILSSGDMADEKTSMTGSIMLFEGLKDKYPVYLASGNHEHWMFDSDQVFTIFGGLGVERLDDESVRITLNGESVTLIGVNDPDYQINKRAKDSLATSLEKATQSFTRDDDTYKILLAHRPEHIKLYEDYGFDLVLSGHAHGGQWRLPGLVNGLYAPNQGFFPKYAGGYYDINEQTDFIVGRGLSLKKFIPRIYNPPEVIVIEFN